MKQKYAVLVLFALILVSSLVSLTSYTAMERMIVDDMSRALAQTLEEQQSDVISPDTIRVFNSHLTLVALRGQALLVVDARQGARPQAQVSAATVFALSDQRASLASWLVVALWAVFCLWQRRRLASAVVGYGGLVYAETEGCFYDAHGQQVRLTPMQHQLLVMLYRAPSHRLTKSDICEALWPKKPQADDTLYALVSRLKPVVEAHSRLRIESDRGRAYGLTVR